MDSLIQTYNNIMAQLVNLPADIDAAQAALDDATMRRAGWKSGLDTREGQLKSQATGKNADERAAALAELQATDSVYRRSFTELQESDAEVKALTREVDGLTRRFTAVGYQCRLHAALLTCLGSAGVPVPSDLTNNIDVVFPRPTDHVNGNGHDIYPNDVAGPADAADLGL